MEWWGILLLTISSLAIGGLIGFLVTRNIFQKQLEKNPPINSKMIRAMYEQMGRKPSESNINKVMEAMKRQQRVGKKTKN